MNKPSERIVVFVTPAQKRAISASADKLGISVSELMRRAVLNFGATSDQVKAASIVDKLHAPRAPDALDQVLQRAARGSRHTKQRGIDPVAALAKKLAAAVDAPVEPMLPPGALRALKHSQAVPGEPQAASLPAGLAAVLAAAAPAPADEDTEAAASNHDAAMLSSDAPADATEHDQTAADESTAASSASASVAPSGAAASPSPAPRKGLRLRFTLHRDDDNKDDAAPEGGRFA